MNYILDLLRILALGWTAMFIGDQLGGSMWAIACAIIGLFAGFILMIYSEETGVSGND